MFAWLRKRWSKSSGVKIATDKLALPMALEDGRVPVMFDRFSYIASAIILALIAWGSIAEIREFARASGKVVPSSFVKLVHHLEGGQVEGVAVREGQVVEKGQSLVSLRPVAAVSDLDQLKVRRAHLKIRMQRLEALVTDTDFYYDDYREFGDLKRREKQNFDIERRRLEEELKTMSARVAQREAEISSLQKGLKSLERQVHISSEKLDIKKRLLKHGYTSRRSYLDAQTEVEEVRSSLITSKGRLATAKEQLAEASAEYQGATSNAKAKYSEEYAQLAGEIAELEKTIDKHQDKVDRLQIVAPVRGIVQELAHRAPGEVVKPGDLVAKIVPVDDDVVAEVNVEPKDIGHVQVGDPAELSISTFDPNVYGVIKGTVKHLSASTFQSDSQSPPYFKAIIQLEKGYVGSDQRPVAILPGMEVEANIVTGAKSLVKYLLKPVYRSLDRSFSER